MNSDLTDYGKFDMSLALKQIKEKDRIHPIPIPEEKGQRLKDLYFKYIRDEEK